MAIKHRFTILCENLVVSQHKKLSFIDIFYNVTVITIPGAMAKFCFAVVFSGDVGDDYSISLEGPPHDERRKLLLVKDRIREENQGAKDRQLISYTLTYGEYQPMVFTAAGIHHIVLREGRKVIFRQPFGVVLAQGTEGINASTNNASSGTNRDDAPDT